MLFGSVVDAPLTFALLETPLGAIQWRSSLARSFGPTGIIKALAKLATKVRGLYVVLRDGQLISYGWATMGRCKHYKIERDAIVIGPIWTDSQLRGRGIATIALQAAIDAYIRRGRKTFYIDTSKTNISAQRVFAKSGFGNPVALYFR